MVKLARVSAGLAIVAAALFSLAGCDYSKQKVAHVRTVTATHEVVFEKDRKRLSASEYEALNTFMQSVPSMAVSYAGIAVDSSNPHALLHAKQLKSYLLKHGVARDTIHLQPSPEIEDTTIELTIIYSVAVPPAPCPDWSAGAGGNYNSTVGTNFGCAYNNDMAVQMANPADLAGGNGQTPNIDPDRDMAIVAKYRGGAAAGGSTGAPATSSTSPSSGTSR